jgi:hypothetical protein
VRATTVELDGTSFLGGGFEVMSATPPTFPA